jgi:hypothetical protein
MEVGVCEIVGVGAKVEVVVALINGVWVMVGVTVPLGVVVGVSVIAEAFEAKPRKSSK